MADIENSLKAILTVAANSYPAEGLHQAFDGDELTDLKRAGDSLAWSIAAELKDAYMKEADAIDNLFTALQVLTNMIADLQATKDGVLEHTVDRIIYDFLRWLKVAKRTTVSQNLFDSWVNVYMREAIQGLGPMLKERLLVCLPKLAGSTPSQEFPLQDIGLDEALANWQIRWLTSSRNNVVLIAPEPPAVVSAAPVPMGG